MHAVCAWVADASGRTRGQMQSKHCITNVHYIVKKIPKLVLSARLTQ